MTTVTKKYRNIPFAHRQPTHSGHCSLVHGHSWGFDVTFASDKLDLNGFIVDFGKLDFIKEYLEEFDHALVLNKADPKLSIFRTLEEEKLCKLVLVDNCGAEGLALNFLNTLNFKISKIPSFHERKARIVEVTCHEDAKNSATVKIDRA